MVLGLSVELVEEPDISSSSLKSISPLSLLPLRRPLAMLTNSDTVRHVIAGSIARTLAQTFIHPIDTIKTRLQVRSPPKAVKHWKKTLKKNPISLALGGKRIIKFRNFLIKGPRDVYLGVTGSILGTLPVGLAYFAAYEACRTWLETSWKLTKENPLSHFISGSTGAIVSCIIRVPTDTIRHRVQAYVHPNVFQSASTIVKTEGMKGLYAGFVPTLMRDVPELALQFTIYERLRNAISARRHNEKLQTWEHLVIGGFSGAVAAVATMPFDVAKTTVQCGTKKGSLPTVLLATYRDKGLKGLFAGMTPRVTQVAVNSALFFALFEVCKMSLKPASLREPSDKLLEPKILNKPRSHIWKRMPLIE